MILILTQLSSLLFFTTDPARLDSYKIILSKYSKNILVPWDILHEGPTPTKLSLYFKTKIVKNVSSLDEKCLVLAAALLF